MIFFADTNFFLECKLPQNLNWQDITNDKEIYLYICYPVIQEIDKHKNNPQKRRKTQKTQALLTDLLKNNKQKEFVLKNGMQMIIKIEDRYCSNELRTIEGLELEFKDDEIIGNIVIFNKQHNENAILLTHDYGMQLKAESFCNVQFIPDDWLSLEKDEVEKENEKLKQQLKEFQEREPKIECAFMVNDTRIQNESKEHFEFTLYEHLSESQIANYMNEIQHHSPKILSIEPSVLEKRIQASAGLKYYPPSQKEMDEYNKKYDEWIKHQELVLKDFTKNHNESQLILPIHIELENKGTSPAENFEISFLSKTGFFFETDDLNKYKKNITKCFWHVPETPKGTFKSLFSMDMYNTIEGYSFFPPTFRNRSLPEISQKEERNKFDFYPFFESGKLIIQCNEMQHQKEKFIFDCYFQIEEDKLKNEKIDFSYSIYSKNLSTTINRTNTINIDINRISAISLIEQKVKERDCL